MSGLKQPLTTNGIVSDYMSNEYRLGLAATLAPMVVPLLMLVMSVIQSGFTYEAIGPWGITIFFVVTCVSYGGLLLIGLPTVYWLRRLDLLSILSLAVVGAVGGVIVGALIRYGFEDQHTTPLTIGAALGPLLLFAGLGVLVSVVFGLIAKVRVR